MRRFTNFLKTPNFPENIVMHSDGVGSKAGLVWQHLELHDAAYIITQDALAMNINDMAIVGCRGPWYYNNTIHVNPKFENAVKPIRDAFEFQDEKWELTCLGGETCITDRVSDIMVDVTMLSGLDYPKWDLDLVSSGDVAYGWNTTGPGANGFTLIRKWFDKLEDFSKKQILSPTKIFRTDHHDLRDVKALVHCTGGGLYKSERWDISIDWYPIEWPIWFENLAELMKHDASINAFQYYTLIKELNGGYQMMAFGPPGLNLGNDWVQLGVVK